ncbi:MAG: hypothetical protein PHU85_17345, partial [Phycisphaerae bacterium]|nr:hypothetical protein [Phycisphaerae bacterium]
VTFTAQGRGLVMVGPRPAKEVNSTAYYHLDLETRNGRRLAYGQYSLGQALVCPWNNWVAIPTYFAPSGRSAPRAGYQICDTHTGQIIRRVVVDSPDLFVPRATAASQPAVDTVAIWRKIVPSPTTRAQEDSLRSLKTTWIVRGDPHRPASIRTEVVNHETFYVVDSPDGRHRLFMRFNGVGGGISKAANPDAEGYAYGFLQDSVNGKRYPVFTTRSGDEFWDGLGSGVVAGPKWLITQPAKFLSR